jgi:TPR repeat protein
MPALRRAAGRSGRVVTTRPACEELTAGTRRVAAGSGNLASFTIQLLRRRSEEGPYCDELAGLDGGFGNGAASACCVWTSWWCRELFLIGHKSVLCSMWRSSWHCMRLRGRFYRANTFGSALARGGVAAARSSRRGEGCSSAAVHRPLLRGAGDCRDSVTTPSMTRTRKMNAGAAALVERAELIKWYDALDALTRSQGMRGFAGGVQMARECQHPDAQWLAALFPVGALVTWGHIRAVMLEQGDDPRAMWLASQLGAPQERVLLRRAADSGYAPAQVSLAKLTDGDNESLLLELSSAQNDRNALFELGHLLQLQANDGKKAIELYRKAAELNHRAAQMQYGRVAFAPGDWERFHWWSQAAERGHRESALCTEIVRLLPSFERGDCGRILSIAAPVIRNNLEVWKQDRWLMRELGRVSVTLEQLKRVIDLHNAMLLRARRAIDCWSMAGRRCKVVKDMRVVIAKLLWEESWRGGDREEDARCEKKAK